MKEYKVEHVSAAIQVVNAIRKAIRNGELKEGDKLPNESEMAAQMGVGRSSIRESMRILKAYGVVDIRQGEGTFIVNRCAEQVFELLGFFPNDDMTMKYLIDLRQIIEPSNIHLNADKITAAQIKELETLVGYINLNVDVEKRIWADAEFHTVLIKASGNPLLVEVYNMLSKMQSNLMNRLMCYEDVVIDAYESHSDILKGLKKHDTANAEYALNMHLLNVKNYYARYYLTVK